ncbi:fatty acyl-CoA hydrolase precursor, medium chain [Adelges cooleyi]|uniref:fatty acyl-CoA hydrolase precursor, medium chain n=1 Tax=Adelges cooleyi TaxID=133065 RepID=UPI00217F3221|nr:fatty acyl-CoA hydrolase precursor, medium chain [Adelges cooleyi]
MEGKRGAARNLQDCGTTITAPSAVEHPRATLACDKMLLALLAYAAAVTTLAAGQQTGVRDVTKVTIRGQGDVSGAVVTLPKIGQRAWTYLGVPYAQPPLGDLRFSPPEADRLPTWTGTRNATAHMPSCIQDLQLLRQSHRPFDALISNLQIRMSEDCLYLNIYRPEDPVPDEKFPVMVWFHPGDFHSGTPMLWDGSVLAAKQKVVVVTTAYRLNILGFYTDNSSEAPGNWGLLDQLAALDWVEKHIDSFGGSPLNITIFGQGAGAISVGLHAVSPLSRDKFNRAISMGGNALQRTAIASLDTETVLEMLVDKYNCFRNTLTGCLKNVDAEELVKEGGSLGYWGPVVDASALNNQSREPFLPDEPAALMAADMLNPAAHMIGYNDMEDAYELYDKMDKADKADKLDTVDKVDTAGVSRDRFEDLIRQVVDGEQLADAGDENCTLNEDFVVDTLMFRYGDQANEPHSLRRNYVKLSTNKNYGSTAYRMATHTSKRNATYMYRFGYKLRTTRGVTVPDWVDAAHMMELPFVWGMPFWTGLSNVDWSAADRRMSERMMNMWTEFARSASPTQKGLAVKWDEFRVQKPRLMVLDKNPNLSQPDQEFEFWAGYYPKVLDVAWQCCENYTTDSTTVAHPMATSLALTALLVCAWPLVWHKLL